MSGLAQVYVQMGWHVTGSDRAIDNPENQEIFEKLKENGISLYPQDGSVYQHENTPDVLVHSTAIEDDNPDFLLAPKNAIRIHRSQALAACINAFPDRPVLAVAGTCGKTTVSAWLSDALYRLNTNPGELVGGAVKCFRNRKEIGNGRLGASHAPFVIEADESDKSLFNYTPDVAIILNIGTDHYSRKELCDVFRKFANSAKKAAIIQEEAYLEIGPDTFTQDNILIFSDNMDSARKYGGHSVFLLQDYYIHERKCFCNVNGEQNIELPMPGKHNAMNALAVFACLESCGYDAEQSLQAISKFTGVARRYDKLGNTANGAAVIDDYAHNVEKICSCIKAAQESVGKEANIYAVFQPHGFKALGFMREEFIRKLPKILRENDRFYFLPVYYAGGTTSFSPTSEEIVRECKTNSSHPEQIHYASNRDSLQKILQNDTKQGDIILIMGARDNSLPVFGESLCMHEKK